MIFQRKLFRWKWKNFKLKLILFLLLLLSNILVILTFLNFNVPCSIMDKCSEDYCFKKSNPNNNHQIEKFTSSGSTFPKNGPIFTYINEGRLGNQMFSYAVLYSIGKYNNYSHNIYLTSWMSNVLSKYFKITIPKLNTNQESTIKWTHQKLTGNPNDYNIKNLNLNHHNLSSNKNKFIKFYGSAESWIYFNEFRTNILNEFTFHNHIHQKSLIKINGIKRQYTSASANANDSDSDSDSSSSRSRSNVTIVGVHVRRDDYYNIANQINLKLPTIQYYLNTMKYFIQKYNQNVVIFIISSDDIEWCILNFSSHLFQQYKFKIYYLKDTPKCDGGLDLSILINCHHIIFSIGTFGFWSGYLNHNRGGGGEIIYCSDCVLSNTTFLKNIGNYSNFILPHWLGFTRNGEEQSKRLVLPTWNNGICNYNKNPNFFYLQIILIFFCQIF